MLNLVEAACSNERGEWRESVMERLVGVVQLLSQARDMTTVMAIVREAARSLTEADGATFVLRDGDQCYYAEENAISPLWKGCRFPMSICISGWVMLNGRSTVIEDIYSDPRIPADAYRPTFVKSLAMVPIRRDDPIGAIGNYWAKRYQPRQEEIDILQALANTTSVALENVRLFEEQQLQLQALREREVRISRQRETLEVFTRAMAHDLKEPVRAVQSFSQLLERKEISAEKKQEYQRIIHGAADRMGMLIDAVSQFIQVDDSANIAGKRCSVNLALVAAKESLSALIRERGAVITSDELPELSADPAHILQLVHHLLANGIRHGGDGVAVHVQAEETEEDWLLSVRDTGPGIAPEYIEKIFLPFKRLTSLKDCSGLGLAVCRKIVDIYRGKIWCESTPGQGATFFVRLPKGTASPDETPEALPLATILLVDDAEFDIELAQVMMLDCDLLQCNLLIARSGREALEILKCSLQSGPGIDLALLDINMPGMDGLEVLEHIRRHEALRDLPVVMCSGSAYEKDRQRAESLAISGYLTKPPSFERLQPIIEKIPTLELHQVNGKHYLSRARTGERHLA